MMNTTVATSLLINTILSSTNYSNISSTNNNINISAVKDKVVVDPTLHLAGALYLTIVGFFATTGNIMVLAVILRDRKLRNKPHNLLLINMAICDLGISFSGYPLTTISGYSQDWIFGDLACRLNGYITFLLSQTSMNTLVAVCIYRYVMICAPGKGFMLTRKFTGYTVLAAWGHGLFWTTLPLIGWGSYGPEPFVISCSLEWTSHDFSSITYMVCTILFCYVSHVAIMINCYRHISRAVKNLAARDRERERRVTVMDDILHLSRVADDQQVTRMCFLVVLVFVSVWTPYAVVSTVHIFYSDIPIAVTAIPTLCAKASCMLNPILYFLTNRTFRVKTMKNLGCKRRDNVVGVETAREVLKTYDKISKDGVYLGRERVAVIQTATMF